MKKIKWLSMGLVGLFGLYIVAAFALIYWPVPDYFSESPMTEADVRLYEESIGVDFSQENSYRDHRFIVRDSVNIAARRYGDVSSKAVFVFVHGIISAGTRWNRLAGLLAAATGAEVIVIDLRGHGESGGARYHVDYIGQYEDDVADVIKTLIRENPDRRVYLAGHSMGGGIALRYALLTEVPAVSGYLLFAPNLGVGPTQKPIQPAEQPILAFNQNRLYGLIMLNLLGFHGLDHLPVLYFNKPPEMPMYSYAAVSSAQPNPPQAAPQALQAVDAPLLVLVGEDDEFFIAENFERVVSENSEGNTVLFPEHNHNSLVNDPTIYETIKQWFAATKLEPTL